ncbi:MAG: hypothetical protein P8J32_05865 [bacterium]|jgi:F0F1-type ATP synthase epsilon subunit|nr:hypothetical protein [bacterium]
MATFTFSLRTPLATFFEGEVDAVRLKTDLGRMEILPDHATLVGTMLYSRVYVRQGATEHPFVIRQGAVSVDAKGAVRLTALDVQEAEGISIESVEEYLVYLNKQLSGEQELNDYQKNFLAEQRSALKETLTNLK